MTFRTKVRICGGSAERVNATILTFHHAGGSALTFSSWARYLPDEVGLAHVELPRIPGEGGRLCGLDKTNFVEESVEAIRENMKPHCSREKLLFFGHSLGALVAYGVASRFAKFPEYSVLGLIAVGRRAPQSNLKMQALCLLDDQKLVETLKKLGGLPDIVQSRPRWIKELLPILRSDLALSDLYAHQSDELLDVPILALRGKDDLLVDNEELSEWKARSSCSVVCQTIEGQHFFTGKDEVNLRQICFDQLEGWLQCQAS